MSEPKRYNPLAPQPYEFTDLRRKLGVTYLRLAEMLGVIEWTLIRWEKGLRVPQLPYIIRFRRLQAAADHLLARRSEPDWTL